MKSWNKARTKNCSKKAVDTSISEMQQGNFIIRDEAEVAQPENTETVIEDEDDTLVYT